jgi:23S rRNA G2445 N2-methylase RlmL
MRTKLFLVAVLAGMLSLTSVNANSRTSESARIEIAQNEVETTLQQIFKATPLEDYIESEETVQVYFRVNNNYEITDVRTSSRNSELANYVYQVLTTSNILLTNVSPDVYSVNLVFDIK